jgi:O-antigen ligase
MLSLQKIKSALSIFAVFLFASFIHPFHFEPYTTYFHDVLTVVGLLILLSYIATTDAPRIIFPKIILIPLGIIAIVAIQVFLKIVRWPDDFLIPFLYFLLVLLAFIIGASFSLQTYGAEAICQGIAVAYLSAALLSVVMQFIQVAGVDAMPFVMTILRDTQPYMRPYANVAQPNQLALLQCLSMASVWWLYQRRIFGAWTSILITLFLLWGLVLTQSRIGWIIVPLFGMICFFDSKDERPLNAWILLFFVVIYGVLVLSLPAIGDVLGIASGSVGEHVGGRSERWVLMQQAWRMALEHPWLGVGWFGFGVEQVRLASDFSAGTYAQHSHNLILNFASELGFPATVLFFSVMAWWFVKCCVSPQTTMILRFANLVFIAVFVHSMVEFPLWYSYFLIPVSLLMGMMHQLRWPSLGVSVRPIPIFLAFIFSGSILVALTLNFQSVTLGFDTLHLKSLGYVADLKLTDRPAFTFFPKFFDYFQFSRSTVHERMSIQEIEFAERNSQRFGYPHILNKLANIYALNDRPKDAARVMLTLQRLHPSSYSEYYDNWRKAAATDVRYAQTLNSMPTRDVE